MGDGNNFEGSIPLCAPVSKRFLPFSIFPFFGRFNFTLKLTVVIPQPQFIILRCHFKLPNKQEGFGVEGEIWEHSFRFTAKGFTLCSWSCQTARFCDSCQKSELACNQTLSSPRQLTASLKSRWSLSNPDAPHSSSENSHPFLGDKTPSFLLIFLSVPPAPSVGPPPAASVAVAFNKAEACSAAAAVAEKWDEEQQQQSPLQFLSQGHR